jgi:6,7-dimethyl-8-ribityllumazine synthase
VATQFHNLSDYDLKAIPDASDMTIGIVVSKWNPEITTKLLDGAVSLLLDKGVSKENIHIQWVPGSFELVFGAKLLAESKPVDSVLVLGCVIRGETPHFEYVCSGVTQGIVQLNLTKNIPFVFGLLTNDTMQQSIDRAGGIHGNKGTEAAVVAIEMIALKRLLQ